MNCSKCGKKLRQDENHCSGCGTTVQKIILEEDSADMHEKHEEQSKGKSGKKGVAFHVISVHLSLSDLTARTLFRKTLRTIHSIITQTTIRFSLIGDTELLPPM